MAERMVHFRSNVYALTLVSVLLGAGLLAPIPIAVADDHDDSHDDSSGDDRKKKWLKLLKEWREKHNDRKKCPDKKKYGDICDKQKPKIKITSPKKNEKVCSPVMILGTAEDKKTGIATVKVRVDRGPYILAEYDANTKEFKFTTEELEPGKHRATAKATDLVGNEKRKSVKFKVIECGEPTTSELTIITKNGSGEEFSGMWTVLFEGNTWNPLQVGFTPKTFTVDNDENYRVGVANFGGKTFVDWENGSTENPMSFSINSDESFTANYLP